jgi:heme/copper-type cytochrome/quinol oxidase subunit 2
MILKGSDTGQSDNSLMYIILAVAVIIIILVVAVIAYAVKKKR